MLDVDYLKRKFYERASIPSSRMTVDVQQSLVPLYAIKDFERRHAQHILRCINTMQVAKALRLRKWRHIVKLAEHLNVV